MRLLFNTDDLVVLDQIYQYCNSAGLRVYYGRTAGFGLNDPCHKIELEDDSYHATYIMLNFPANFEVLL